MRVIEGLDALGALPRAHARNSLEARSVVVVGVFDGVHLGHQRLLHELVEMASQLTGVPTVVTFREHPDALLRGQAPPLLVSVPHRLRLLRRAGVERVLLLDFDDALRALTAADFARTVLRDGLHTEGLLLGYDAALGRDRDGTPARMRELGKELGFAVRVATPFTVDEAPVSSTRIRSAILGGDLTAAHRLLGRWPSVLGRVVHGDGRGRGLGFATANVAPDTDVLPPGGVYAVYVLLEGESHAAVANLGVRPTFEDGGGERDARLEVHVLDFDGDVYGAVLEVCFAARLRDERRFADAAALAAQIREDVGRARRVLAT